MDKGAITGVSAIQILDSRGAPTVKARVTLACGQEGAAAVPSGASTGAHEAHELRDGGNAYGGKGVTKAVANVNGPIARALIGQNALDQQAIDRRLIALDGTKNKSSLGANALLAVSLATARAAAAACSLPLYRYLGGNRATSLPLPMLNILNGGAHADNNVDLQEFMIVPLGAAGFEERLRVSAEVYAALKRLLKAKGLSTAVGDEGGFAPNLSGDEQAIELILEAITQAGYAPGTQVALALDAAVTDWLTEKNTYLFPKSKRELTTDQMISYFQALTGCYPIISLEDPLHEDDFEGFSRLRAALPGVQIVGDDLFVTDVERLARGIAAKSATAILIKPNQIGTLTQTADAIELAHSSGMKAVMSHRSGETEDSIIADLAVGYGTGQIKTGAPCRSDRVSKYNRLLEIAQEVNPQQPLP